MFSCLSFRNRVVYLISIAQGSEEKISDLSYDIFVITFINVVPRDCVRNIMQIILTQAY